MSDSTMTTWTAAFMKMLSCAWAGMHSDVIWPSGGAFVILAAGSVADFKDIQN